MRSVIRLKNVKVFFIVNLYQSIYLSVFKDLEKLITEKCVLNLVTEILWTKKEKRDDVERQAEVGKGEGKKEEDDWMEVWGRERRRNFRMIQISNDKLQVNLTVNIVILMKKVNYYFSKKFIDFSWQKKYPFIPMYNF